MTRIRVEVTQADIEAGRRGIRDACPLALALRRRGYPTAQVVAGKWWIYGSAAMLRLSDTAADFVYRVDMGESVQPATFVVEGPAL